MDKLCRPQPGYADWRREYAGLAPARHLVGPIARSITLDAELASATLIRWMPVGMIGEAPDRGEYVLHAPLCDPTSSGQGVP